MRDPAISASQVPLPASPVRTWYCTRLLQQWLSTFVTVSRLGGLTSVCTALLGVWLLCCLQQAAACAAAQGGLREGHSQMGQQEEDTECHATYYSGGPAVMGCLRRRMLTLFDVSGLDACMPQRLRGAKQSWPTCPHPLLCQDSYAADYILWHMQLLHGCSRVGNIPSTLCARLILRWCKHHRTAHHA